MNRTISSSELQSMLGKPDLTILDVRRSDDYTSDTSIIPGATWHDPTQIENWSKSLTADKEIVLYCVRGGAVSNSVVDALQAKGLRVRYIEGGISAWKEAGGKVAAK